MHVNITSASGILALLEEPDAAIKAFALSKLNHIVDVFWPEIADSIHQIEILFEDEEFSQRELAALVASKVYYHLGAFEDSVQFALGAGKNFNVNATTEYVETIIAKAIDQYTSLRVKGDTTRVDPRLEEIVNRMFQRCLEDGELKQAVGIALETRRLDIFVTAVTQSKNIPDMLQYSLRVCMQLIDNRQFRNSALRELVTLFINLRVPDYISVCQCLIFLDDPNAVADILKQLLQQETKQILTAYQIGFDLYENATQQFLEKIRLALRMISPKPLPPLIGHAAGDEEKKSASTTPVSMETENSIDECVEKPPPSTELSEPFVAEKPSFEGKITVGQKDFQANLLQLDTILSGDIIIEMHLQFLIRNNKVDALVLKKIKDQVRNSITHNSAVVCNGFVHAGTTSDQFLRDNLEWLARSSNWAKFSATSSLGVIHRGHEKEALKLMSTYLPKDSSAGSAYTEGGGLYALGLIHANHGGEITEYLLNQLKGATTDIVRHGAALGLGLAAMGTSRQDVYEQLKYNLYQDEAVTGEAVGIAIGLVMLGTKNPQAIEDMIAYAHETQHEKIMRGLAIGIAMTMFGRLEEADLLIDSLTKDKDPIMRWSGVYTVALSYCGTGNNQAIRKLLHIAVSDASDDVRRIAVMSLGFILYRMPEQCPSIVSLLSESYNPHVRYGAAMALGISCAGTGLKEALTLLEPLLEDAVNYVRQGAFIASALILVQQNEVTCPKLNVFKDKYTKVVADKHDDLIAKFGAVLSQGIINAGGRNCVISLCSRSGQTNMMAVVGMLLFQQFWYWYPLTHCLALTFTPSCVIGLNAQLKMPKIEIKSNAKSSTFAYPPFLEEKKDKAKEKVETAVLSTTAKHKHKEEAKRAASKSEGDLEKMDTTEAKPSTSAEPAAEEGEAKVEPEKEEKKPEPRFEMLENPARVMRAQLKVISLPESSGYRPLKDIQQGGIVILEHLKPGEQEDVVELMDASGPTLEEDESLPEPEPPEPFEYIE